MSESRFPWRTLLFVSVALNLLVIGAVAGAWSAGVRVARQGDDRAAAASLAGSATFLRALPPETRELVREQLIATWAESRDVRLAARQARREAFEAIAQEPYDADRVRAAFERARAADQAAIGVFQNDIADALGELTPEQRREALQALRRNAPMLRREGAGLANDGQAPRALDPERREQIQERRQERRERWRERREQRLRQQQPAEPPQP